MVEANTVLGAGGTFWLSDTEMAVRDIVEVVPRSEGKFKIFSLSRERLRRIGGGGGRKDF